MKHLLHPIMPILLMAALSGCKTDSGLATSGSQAGRIFQTSFEALSDFDDFYIVPPGDYGSSHLLATDLVRDQGYSHKAWILEARAATNDGLVYSPHRAYPTIQLYKTAEGSYVTPCLISLWVYLDMDLVDRPTGSIDDWFSFATLSPDTSDSWLRTIGVNIVHDGYVRLVHVPGQGEQEYLFQSGKDNDPEGKLLFPFRQWVKLDVYLDLSSANGFAKVWQNGELVSYASVEGGSGKLEQAHFGLYASAAIPSGTIYNDKLVIREIADETEALLYINKD